MPENELDSYSVPIRKRFGVFKSIIGTLCAALSVVFFKLMVCQSHTEEVLNNQLKYFQQQTQSEVHKSIQRADNKISPQINDLKNDIDTLTDVLKTLNN